MAGWVWSVARRQYIAPNGTPLTSRAAVALRDGFTAARAEVARGIAAEYSAGTLTRVDFAVAFHRFVEETLVASFLAGRGGINAALEADALAIRRLITDQLGYASEFVLAVERDGLSAAQIEARAALYADAAVTAYEEARALAHGFRLPAYPADGSTTCRSACRCAWQIDESDTEWRCTWQTSGDDRVCPECAAYGREWSPLVIAK